MAETKDMPIKGLMRLPRGRTILILVAGVLALVFLGWWSVHRQDEYMRSDLLSDARAAAKAVNWRHIPTLTASDADLASPDYQRLKEQLSMVQTAKPEYRFTYLLGQRPDKSIFIFVDSEPPDSKDHSPPGQIYSEATDSFRRIFATGHEAVVGPVEDRWGTWVIALVPVTDPKTGKLVAVFGIDRNAADWNRELMIEVIKQTALVMTFVAPLIVFMLLRQRNERLLHEAHQNLLDIVQFLPDATVVINLQGKVTAWNRAMEEFSGVKAEEMLGKGDYEYAIPIYGERRPILVDMIMLPQAEFEGRYPQIERRGDTLFTEAYMRNARGEEVYFQGSAVALHNSNNEIIGAIETIRDITLRKRTEEKLLILSRGIEQSPASVIITDREGNIEYVNPKFTCLTGYTYAEAIGKNPRILKSGLIPSEVHQQLWETIISGSEWRGEFCNKKKNDELYWESASISPIITDDGEITHFIGVKEDITERKRLEIELQKAKVFAEETAQRLELALEGSNDATWEWDLIAKEGVINARYFEMTEYAPGEMDPDYDFFLKTIHPDDFPEVQRRIKEHLEGKTGKFVTHYRMVTNSGKLRDVMGRGKIVMRDEDGRPTKMAGVVTDMTEMKKLNDEVNRIHNLESIGLLAGGLAHDFNNVLNIIYGNITYSRMLAGENEDIAESLRDAEDACERAKELGVRLQIFSQGGCPAKELIALPKVIDNAAGTVFNNSKIMHNITVAADLFPLEVDPRQIRRVFENLLINAKEAMVDGGSVNIDIKNCVIDGKEGLPLESGSYICIALQDEGKGIPEDILPKIFNPYFSTKDTYNQKGLGLGLSICHSVIKRHRGHISVESTPGVGTRVTLYLPACQGFIHSSPSLDGMGDF
jgi:PAS domain S-box-containing protein